MSKNLETKTKILSILKHKNMTVVELSERLGLARATIRQHIKDLTDVGTIEEIPNAYFKKHVSYRAKRMYGKTMLKDARLHWRNGNALFEKKDFEKALKEFTAATSIDPKYIDAYYNKALTEEEMDRLDAAEKDLKIVFQMQPRSSDAAVLMGAIEEKKGRMDKARQWYEISLRYNPGYYWGKQRLDILNAKNGK